MIEGGVGLQTGDDRRFLAAIEGSGEANAARAMQERLEALTLAHEAAASRYRALRRDGRSVEQALLAIADEYHPMKELKWPKSGLIRIAPADAVHTTRLSADEVDSGIEHGPTWVPFEKGDSSGDDGGAAKWRRENPVVVDWTPQAVELLRTRVASGESYRKPYLRNERLWGKTGVTFNSIASYLRARAVPDGGIFGHKTPVIRPTVDWLPPKALLALLNAPSLDFALRTFLGSRMQIEIGDIRRLPIPVLTTAQTIALDSVGHRAIVAKRALDAGRSGESLESIEAELDAYTRELYGLAADANLWVVR